MPIQTGCPSCGKLYNLKDKFAGVTVKCPQCQAVMTVPVATAAPVATPSAPAQQQQSQPLSAPPPLPPASPAAQPAPPPAAPLPGGGVDSLFGDGGVGANLSTPLPSFGSAPPAAPSSGFSVPGLGAPGMGAPGFGAPAMGGFGAPPQQAQREYGSPYANYAFNRDKFLIRQKRVAINAKYYIWDEQNRQVLFVERPAHLFRNLTALLAGLVVGFIAFILVISLFGALSNVTDMGFFFAIGFILAIPAGLASGVAINILLCVKRHITVYRDDTKQEHLMEIFQDRKFWLINATYTMVDNQGQLLGFLRKNYLFNLFRKRWYVTNPEGQLICLAKEDSIFLGILRRFLGSFYGLLRTNFIIVDPATDDIKLGEFNRKFTLFDRYVLDMSPDYQQYVDRRIALAVGILLDTGESR